MHVLAIKADIAPTASAPAAAQFSSRYIKREKNHLFCLDVSGCRSQSFSILSVRQSNALGVHLNLEDCLCCLSGCCKKMPPDSSFDSDIFQIHPGQNTFQVPLAFACGSWSTQIVLFFYPVYVQQFADCTGSNGAGCVVLRVYLLNPAVCFK